MADNFPIKDAGGLTINFAADDISGVLHQRVKLSLGADGSAVDAPGDGTIGLWVNITNASLDTIATNTGRIPAQGPAVMAASLPVAIASDQPDIRVSTTNGAALVSNYTQAGVIAINTVLLTMDCSQYRGMSIQCASMGSSGVVTPEWSNNNSTWVACTIITPAGVNATTFNAAGLWVVPVCARYLRLRLSTATTAGTTTITVYQFNDRPQHWLATQPVSGTVTANAAATSNLIGDVGIQFRGSATGGASIKHLISAATTNATNVKPSAGRVAGWSISNTTASWRYVKLHNTAGTPTAGAGVVQTIAVPPNGVNNMPLGGGSIGFATGIAFTTTTGSADADANAVGAGDLIIDIFYA